MTRYSHLLTLGVLLLPLTGCTKPITPTQHTKTEARDPKCPDGGMCIHDNYIQTEPGYTIELYTAEDTQHDCVKCTTDWSDHGEWWTEAGIMCHAYPKERKPCGK